MKKLIKYSKPKLSERNKKNSSRHNYNCKNATKREKLIEFKSTICKDKFDQTFDRFTMKNNNKINFKIRNERQGIATNFTNGIHCTLLWKIIYK